MRAALTIAVIAVLALSGAMATLKSCADTQCSSHCSTDTTGPDTCKAASGSSGKYVCASGNVSILTFLNSDCSGSPVSSLDIGKDGVCGSYGKGSFLVTCSPASGVSALVAVVAVVAALLF